MKSHQCLNTETMPMVYDNTFTETEGRGILAIDTCQGMCWGDPPCQVL